MNKDFEVAKDKAIKFIGISRKTSFEVIRKLKTQNVEDLIIDDVISYLTQLGYINDKDYVDAYVIQCMRLFTYSSFEIKQKLLQKGIKKDIIDKGIQIWYDEKYDERLIKKILETKCKNMEELKQKQYLYRRGFKLDSFE